MTTTIDEIDHQSDRQPDGEPEPGVAWQSAHEREGRKRTERRSQKNCRCFERPVDIRLRNTQDEHADANDREGKERPDADQFADDSDRK